MKKPLKKHEREKLLCEIMKADEEDGLYDLDMFAKYGAKKIVKGKRTYKIKDKDSI